MEYEGVSEIKMNEGGGILSFPEFEFRFELSIEFVEFMNLHIVEICKIIVGQDNKRKKTFLTLFFISHIFHCFHLCILFYIHNKKFRVKIHWKFVLGILNYTFTNQHKIYIIKQTKILWKSFWFFNKNSCVKIWYKICIKNSQHNYLMTFQGKFSTVHK